MALGFDARRIDVVRRDNALVFPSHEPVVADLDASARAVFRSMPGGVWREPKGYVIVTAAL